MLKKAGIVSIFVVALALTFSQVGQVNAANITARPTAPKPSPSPKPTSPKPHGKSLKNVTYTGTSRIFNLH